MLPSNKFVISSMSDMNVPSKNIDTDIELKKLINDNLNIINYSTKIKELYMTYMVIDPKTKSFRADKKFWHWKTGLFDFFINVPDYEAFCKATEIEARSIIAQLFLKGINTYLSIRNDINHKQLLTDTINLFVNEAIITPIHSQYYLQTKANSFS